MLSKLKLGPKLLLAPAVVVLALLVVALGAYATLLRQNQSLDAIMQERAVRLKATAELSSAAHGAHGAAYQLLTSLHAGFAASRTQAYAHALHARHGAIARQFADMDKLVRGDAAERRLVQQLQAAHAAYVQTIHDALDIAADDHAIAANAMSRAERAFDAVAQRLAELVRLEQALADHAYRRAEADFSRLTLWLPVLVALSVGLALLVTFVVRRALLREVDEIGAVAADLAEGQLGVRTRCYGHDEIAATARALDISIRNLNTTLKTIAASADGVDSGAQKLARSAAVLRRSAERRAEAAQQATTALQDLGDGAAQAAGELQMARYTAAALEVRALLDAAAGARQDRDAAHGAGAAPDEGAHAHALHQAGQTLAALGDAGAAQRQQIDAAHAAIRELAHVTQQQLPLVRQAAIDAGSLQRQAQHLSASVAQFRLGSATDPQAGVDMLTRTCAEDGPRVVRLRLAAVRS